MGWQDAPVVQSQGWQSAPIVGGAAPDDIPAPRRTGTRVDQIPGSSVRAPASTAVPEKPESGFFGKLISPLETAVTLGTSAITAPLVEASKVYGTLTSGQYGTPAGIRAGEETGRKVQQFFQPTLSREAEAQTQALGNALASTGLQGVPLNMLGNMSTLAKPAVQQVAPVIKAPLEARAARVQEGRVAQSYANAPMIDAAQSVQRIGGAIPPAISNPTTANVIKGKLAGPELKQRLVKENETAVTEKVRKDLGVKPTEKLAPEVDEAGKLNFDSPITRALDEASKPYEPIRKMESLAVPKESIDALETLRKAAPIGGDAKTAAINSIVDDALTKLQRTTSGPFSGVGGGPVDVGRSGAAVLDDIRSLRRDAQTTYRAQKINPDPLATAKADTQMAIANILEDVIDANAPSAQILSDLKKARTRIAQIYEHERAINYGQQKIDPQMYAKLYEERKGGMTGLNADIAKAAAMFPDYFTLTPAEIKGLPRLTRGGVGGAIGGALGAPFGPVGFVAGTAAGMGIGSVAGGVAAKRMATPAYQRANAMPMDYRPVPSGLRPVEPNATPNGLVPYNYAQQTTEAPNFILRPNQYAPQVTTPGFAPGPAQLPAPSAEGTMNMLRTEDARRAAMSRTLGQQAEQQAAAAEAAARRPARGGVELVFDADGNLVEAPTAGAGGVMTAPSALESAVAKMSGQMYFEPKSQYETVQIGSFLNRAPMTETRALEQLNLTPAESKKYALPTRQGQAFNMTAEEKIAWNKAKADLAEVMPGMKALDDKAIAAKLMDREWIQQAVIKSKEKAKMLDDIIARSDNERLRQDAMMKREVLDGNLEMLEEQYRKARPVKTGGQGPKTRAFQRNMLRPEGEEIQNALVK